MSTFRNYPFGFIKSTGFFVLLFCSTLFAQSWLEPAYGIWGAGVVSRDRNYVNTKSVIAPGLFIFGGYGPVFIEANRAGYSFFSNGTYFASAVINLRTHQFRKDDKNFSDRKSAVELGVHLGRRWPANIISRLAVLQDVIATHKSYELDLQVFRRSVLGPVRLLTAVGIQYQSQKLADYYYGTVNYKPSPALGSEIEIIVTYPFNSWAFFAGTRIYFFDRQISDSPIADGNRIDQFFSGIGYKF